MAPSPPPSAGRSAPPNPPNYWARRLGVFAVVGIIGYAAVVAVGAFLGSDDDVADDPSDSPVSASGAIGAANVEEVESTAI
ncbi:MAG: hypothetical protein GKR86_09445, partial [Ilumatobacter sp.]|nr:hypothetical protein [Ilumatobacter sp.]